MFDKLVTCCFSGHRDIPYQKRNEIFRETVNAVEDLIKQGVLNFLSGGAVGFDLLAARAVQSLKEKYPKIKLVMVLPCRNQHLKWSKSDKIQYEEILSTADELIYLNDEYITGCMHQRNTFLVNQSSFCIAYFSGLGGGTAFTLNRAREKGLFIYNIFK